MCTNLLGFWLIIPITTSFIEGRSPPFISPIYSPCETMEMCERTDALLHRMRPIAIATQDKDSSSLQGVSAGASSCRLRCTATYGTDGNNSFIDSHPKTISDSAALTLLLDFLFSSCLTIETISHEMQKSMHAVSKQANKNVDTYIFFLVLFFHSTQGVMQCGGFEL